MQVRLFTCRLMVQRAFASIQSESTKKETQSAKTWPSATPLDGPDISTMPVRSFHARGLIATSQSLKKIILATSVIAIMEGLGQAARPMLRDAIAIMQGLGRDASIMDAERRSAIVSSSAFPHTTAVMGHASFKFELLNGRSSQLLTFH